MTKNDEVAQGDLNSTAKGSGARRNKGKIALSLIPFHLLAGCGRVFMGGKLKYAEWNWARGMRWSTCFDCALRHLFKWWFLGEDIDPESGEHHLDHVFANLFMLRHYVDNYKEGDDRPPAYVEFGKSMDDFNKRFDEEAYLARNPGFTPREVEPHKDSMKENFRRQIIEGEEAAREELARLREEHEQHQREAAQFSEALTRRNEQT